MRAFSLPNLSAPGTSVADLLAAITSAARNLLKADGATFVLRDGNDCYYADELAISPLWRGRRFPMTHCISGWVMLNKRPAVIPDIYADDRIPHDAYRPTFVKSLIMVPVNGLSAPAAAIGNYWAKKHSPLEGEVRLLQSLADTVACILDEPSVRDELRSNIIRPKDARRLPERS